MDDASTLKKEFSDITNQLNFDPKDLEQRRPQTESDDIDEVHETDIEDFIDAELGALLITPIQVEEDDVADRILEEGYSEESQRIARYLMMLCKLEGMSRPEF